MNYSFLDFTEVETEAQNVKTFPPSMSQSLCLIQLTL